MILKFETKKTKGPITIIKNPRAGRISVLGFFIFKFISVFSLVRVKFMEHIQIHI